MPDGDTAVIDAPKPIEVKQPEDKPTPEANKPLQPELQSQENPSLIHAFGNRIKTFLGGSPQPTTHETLTDIAEKKFEESKDKPSIVQSEPPTQSPFQQADSENSTITAEVNHPDVASNEISDSIPQPLAEEPQEPSESGPTGVLAQREQTGEQQLPNLQSNDPYEILGLRRDASLEEVQNAGRKLLRENHPDLTQQENNERVKTITYAYDTLKNPSRRMEYDAKVSQQQTENTPHAIEAAPPSPRVIDIEGRIIPESSTEDKKAKTTSSGRVRGDAPPRFFQETSESPIPNKTPDASSQTQEEPNPEQNKLNETLQKVFDQGGFSIMTSLPPEVREGAHDLGFTTVNDNKIIEKFAEPAAVRKETGLYDENGKNYEQIQKYENAGIHEVIAVAPLTEPIYETKKTTREVPTILGNKTEIVETQEKIGERPILHNETVTVDGKAEPAVAFYYTTVDNPNIAGENGSLYRDYSGRAGQTFEMQIILPESTAKELMEQIKQDPTVLRQLIDKVAVDKMKIDASAWKDGTEKTQGHAIRPPYETWDAQTKAQSKESSTHIIGEERLFPKQEATQTVVTQQESTNKPEQATETSMGEELPEFTPQEQEYLKKMGEAVSEARKRMTDDELKQFIDGLSLSPRLLEELHKQIATETTDTPKDEVPTEQPKPDEAQVTDMVSNVDQAAAYIEAEASKPDAPEKVKEQAKVLRALFLALKYGLITAAGAGIIVAGTGVLAMSAAGKMGQLSQ